ncbi:MAG: FAD-dependent oxidoreductase, partial [Rhodospirillales bacterium]
MTTFDIAIIGAGPAGMAAAHEAKSLGLSAVIIDEQDAPGGQIYRDVERVVSERPQDIKVLGEAYAFGRGLVDGLRGSGIDYLPGHMVWQIERDGTVWCSDGTRAKRIRARAVLLATGAMERPVPVPGWTLPGVMTAGAAQILMKSAGMLADGPIILAGSGPLLLLVADQLIQSGADLVAVCETTTFTDYLAALPHLPKALTAMDYLQKGLQMRRRIKAHGVPIIDGISALRVEGVGRASGISFKTGQKTCTIPASTVLLHQGVIPNTQASRQLRLEHDWHRTQRYWYPKTDRNGSTDAETIFIAG